MSGARSAPVAGVGVGLEGVFPLRDLYLHVRDGLVDVVHPPAPWGKPVPILGREYLRYQLR